MSHHKRQLPASMHHRRPRHGIPNANQLQNHLHLLPGQNVQFAQKYQKISTVNDAIAVQVGVRIALDPLPPGAA
jgi:hypothetical protein